MPLKYLSLSANQLDALASRDDVIAVIPVGSVEQHCGAPLGLDVMIAESIAWRACEALERRGSGLCVILPSISYGHSPEWAGVRGTISLDGETFLRLMKAIISSIITAGFKRVVLLNGHGGNAGLLEAAARELAERAAIMTLNYWEAAGSRLDHAGPIEIAVARALGIETGGEDCEEMVIYSGRPRIAYGRARRPAKMLVEGEAPGDVAEAVASALERLLRVREGTYL